MSLSRALAGAMDEEFLHDFVGKANVESALMKETSSGESLPRVKTGDGAHSGRTAADATAAASVSHRAGAAATVASSGGASAHASAHVAGGITSMMEATARATDAGEEGDDDSPHAAAVARDLEAAKRAAAANAAPLSPAPASENPIESDAALRRSWSNLLVGGLDGSREDDVWGSRSPSRAPRSDASSRPASAGSGGSGAKGAAEENDTSLSTSAPSPGSSSLLSAEPTRQGSPLAIGRTSSRSDGDRAPGSASADAAASPSRSGARPPPGPGLADHSRPDARGRAPRPLLDAGASRDALAGAEKTDKGARSAERIQRNTSSFVLDAESNPTPQSIPPPVFGDQGNIGEKHVLVMVGLPARGKTHMAKRLCQYLRFFHGARTQVFNVGTYRRKMMTRKKADAQFFDQRDAESEALRKSFARAALKDMIDFLFQEDNASYLEQRGFDSGRVAIFDATNTTRARREWIREQLGRLPLKLLFVESVCTDEEIIERNIWQAKVNNDDYRSEADKKKAYDDFRKRIAKYEEVYEPMQEEHLSFIKLINEGRRVEINNIHGFLLGRIVQFLSNLHATHQTIYLSRHGQSEYNFQGKIGGDSVLSRMGENYATMLAKYCEDVICVEERGGVEGGGGAARKERHPRPCRLWTSSLQRTILTARHIAHPKIKLSSGRDWVQMAPRVLRNLDEIYAGVCDGMTYEEIEENYPEEFHLRQQNKLGYRYPRGESYLDVISRLDPLVQELESYQEPVLIVGHQGVLRLIYAYFMGMDRSEACTASIPLNTVIKLTPKTHTCEEERDVLYRPTRADLGVVNEEGENAGGGVSPTASVHDVEGNPFAMNTEPPSY